MLVVLGIDVEYGILLFMARAVRVPMALVVFTMPMAVVMTVAVVITVFMTVALVLTVFMTMSVFMAEFRLMAMMTMVN